MNNISKGQLYGLLLITDMFGLFCWYGSMSIETLYGVLAGIGVQLLVALVYAMKCGRLRKWALWYYLINCFFCGGIFFSALWRTSSIINIPYVSDRGIWGKLIIAGIIAAVCLYSSSTGIKPVARAAVIAAAAGIFCLVIDLISAVFSGEWSNVPLMEKRNPVGEAVRGFAYSGGLGSFAVLLGAVKGDRIKAAIGYFTAKAVVSALLILTVLPVAGGIMNATDFPVISAVQLSQPFDSQRIDSLFLIIFVIYAVFSAALQVMTGAYILKELFPKFDRWRSSTAIAFIIAAALLISGRELLLICACAAAAALIIAPVGAVSRTGNISASER